MLRPQDTSTRERKPLGGLWSFRLDAAGDGRRDQWFAAPLADAREMAAKLQGQVEALENQQRELMERFGRDKKTH